MKIEHAKQMSDIQARMIQRQKKQPRSNNLWPKRNPPTKQRPPNPQINMFRREFHFPLDDRIEVMKNSRSVETQFEKKILIS